MLDLTSWGIHPADRSAFRRPLYQKGLTHLVSAPPAGALMLDVSSAL